MVVRSYVAILCSAWILLIVSAVSQTASDYDGLVQKGKTQLQAGSADLALASGEVVIKINADRWEGYALAGGALMNLKRYEEGADRLSQAISRAPEAKQAALRDLRRQCLLAESGSSPAPKEAPPTMTQAEIVLWKSIENSTSPADFQAYLDQYPHGAFVVLAQRRLTEAKARKEQAARAALQAGADLPGTVWKGDASQTDNQGKVRAVGGLTVMFHGAGKVDYYPDRFGGAGTWSMSNSTLTISLPGDFGNCGIDVTGSRQGNSMEGTWKWSKGLGCSHHGTWHVTTVGVSQ
jgi:tetratricopeptide (TPR) repeat protein